LNEIDQLIDPIEFVSNRWRSETKNRFVQ